MTATPRFQHRAAARGRILLWCAALVLFLQLFSAAAHDHELAAKAPDCVACTLHAQAQAALPCAAPAPAAGTPVLVRIVATATPLAPALRPPSYLLPQAQAPPAFLPA